MNPLRNSVILLLLITVLPVGHRAGAASITTVTLGAGGSGNFGFAGPNGTVISDTIGGVLLTATANTGDINGSSEGIGVYHYISEGGLSDDGEIDDHYFVDRLLLNFSVPVTLTEVVVGGIELNVVAVQFPPPIMYYDPVRIENTTTSSVLFSGTFSSAGFQTLSFAANNIGTDFLLRPEASIGGSGYRLRALTFSTPEAAVSEPAGFALVAAGLLSLTLCRRWVSMQPSSCWVGIVKLILRRRSCPESQVGLRPFRR